MTQLVWDQVGDRRFETGVDRGVLYLPDATAVPWNGLTSIEEQPGQTSQSFHLDGVKFLERITPGDFTAVLKAYTFPEEFEALNGVSEIYPGVSVHDQSSQAFNLSYRTRIGNDVDGADHAYRIHILYNVIAIPSNVSHQTLGDTLSPTDFSWTLKGVPPVVEGWRPSVHISIDSTKIDPELLVGFEDLIYGTDTEDPFLPPLDQMITILEALYSEYNTLLIVDNGDGTWTATDIGGGFITMIDDTTFSIDNADVTYLDAVTYEIEDTTLP